MGADSIAAIAGATLIGVVIVFQLGLVAGAAWGQAAWGGRTQGRLPLRLRLASAASVLILAALAWIMLTAAELVAASPIPPEWLSPAMWVVAGYFVIGALMNAISRSPVERLWAPVSLAAAICAVIVAASR